MQLIVFDIGGTLMEYQNMPNVWIDYYKDAFAYVRTVLHLNLTDEDLAQSIEILKSYNPRIKYREIEYSPEEIFTAATAHWPVKVQITDVIAAFFSSIHLVSYIYPETIEVLTRLKQDGYLISTLTDVATGMPDELHKSYFPELMPYFDLYVSSSSCGYRKPNPKGLIDISEYFDVPKDEILFVGDEEKDILTAKNFGCKSVWINRKRSKAVYGQDYTISDLAELPAIL